MCRLVAEEQKRKKDEVKRRAHKKMAACYALERHHRTRAREGLPLESSPSSEEEEDDDDDDDEGMEVCANFGPKARLGPVSSPTSPSGGATLPVKGPLVALSEARASTEPTPVPAEVEEVATVEERVASLPVEAIVVPVGAPSESPQRPSIGGNTEEGHVTPPHVAVSGSAVVPTIASPLAPEPGFVEEVTTVAPSLLVGEQRLRV
jgi:hypothetical protein